MEPPLFPFDNTYYERLEGTFIPVEPAGSPDPRLLAYNTGLAAELGLPVERLRESITDIVAGNLVPDGAAPLAQAYAGHQFGHLSPLLGDGRALLLGEVVDNGGVRRDIQLKGSGPTPFSRGGDGRATIGPILREYLVGEAMHHLGVPTTRALAAITTGMNVRRDRILPGAVLARVAQSHLRVGTFVLFAHRGEVETVSRLARYTLERHFPERARDDNVGLALLESVAEAQAQLITKWMLLGFVHGVMNTDNSTLSGETIDYGPCAFLDTYDPTAVFSSIDRGGRYAFGHQPRIGAWNLARLAEALLPLIDEDSDAAIEKAGPVVTAFGDRYRALWTAGMREKLGLTLEHDGDEQRLEDFTVALKDEALDYTGTIRRLSAHLRGAAATLPDGPLASWVEAWRVRIAEEAAEPSAIADAMDAVNPLYIPRNHRVEHALDAAIGGDLGPFERMLEVLRQPFTAQPGAEEFAEPAPPDFGPYQTFCGT